MIWSGLLLLGNDVYRIGWGDDPLPFLSDWFYENRVGLPPADGMAWHFLVMWFLASTVVCALRQFPAVAHLLIDIRLKRLCK